MGCFTVQEANGELECSYRWYYVPEETHTGRQVGTAQQGGEGAQGIVGQMDGERPSPLSIV